MDASQMLTTEPVADQAADLWQRLGSRYGAATPEQAVMACCEQFVSRHSDQALPRRLDALLAAADARRESRDITGHGRLELDAHGRFVVVVHRDHHWSRQRFTCAHELAHILLFREFAGDQDALQRLRSAEEWQRVERLCNIAAAEMLMPTNDLHNAVKEWGLGPLGLSRLMSRYAVSWSALLVRLSELLHVPVAVFRHHARHQSEPVCWRVHRMYGGTHGTWLPSGLTTRHLSSDLIERAHAEGASVAAPLTIELSGRTTEAFAIGTSMTAARLVRAQRSLLDPTPSDEPDIVRWREVVSFLFATDQGTRRAMRRWGIEPPMEDEGVGAHVASDLCWEPLTLF